MKPKLVLTGEVVRSNEYARYAANGIVESALPSAIRKLYWWFIDGTAYELVVSRG